MIKDTLGEKAKALEAVFAKETYDPSKHLLIRLDGKTFHTFTKGLKRPFDDRLSSAMIATMNFLVEKTNADLGYTQSDEISLYYKPIATPETQPYLGARIQKLTSVLASMATAVFNDEVRKTIPEKENHLAFFDCRLWTVDNIEDVVDVFKWRFFDALKNSVSMAAHAALGHKATLHKNTQQKIDMMEEKGISWVMYPDMFKFGTYAVRETFEQKIPEELKHFPSNEGKETFIRHQIYNFSYTGSSEISELIEGL